MNGYVVNADGSRTYDRAVCCAFCRVREEWGQLANFAFMRVRFVFMDQRIVLPTSEHLYQGLRFENSPELARAIFGQPDPFKAKALCREFLAQGHGLDNWDSRKVNVMRKVLAVKLEQHPELRELLERTGDRPIVELSVKDSFWGARPVGNTLVGKNALGRLWMELREDIRSA